MTKKATMYDTVGGIPLYARMKDGVRQVRLMTGADRQKHTFTLDVRPSVFVEPSSIGCEMRPYQETHGGISCDNCGCAIVDHWHPEGANGSDEVEKALTNLHIALAVYESALLSAQLRKDAQDGYNDHTDYMDA